MFKQPLYSKCTGLQKRPRGLQAMGRRAGLSFRKASPSPVLTAIWTSVWRPDCLLCPPSELPCPEKANTQNVNHRLPSPCLTSGNQLSSVTGGLVLELTSANPESDNCWRHIWAEPWWSSEGVVFQMRKSRVFFRTFTVVKKKLPVYWLNNSPLFLLHFVDEKGRNLGPFVWSSKLCNSLLDLRIGKSQKVWKFLLKRKEEKLVWFSL
jgi:hypothetical protein